MQAEPVERSRRKLVQGMFRSADGGPLPRELPDGYRTATLRFRIPKGSISSRPLADSRFLPVEAHRERCWLAYADALNSDHEPSVNGLGTFPDEYRSLFEGRARPGSALAQFAKRWGLRAEDVAMSLRLSESRWHQTDEIAGYEPPQRLPLVPTDAGRTIVGEVKVRYDPTEMTRAQVQRTLNAEIAAMKKSFSSAFHQTETAVVQKGLRQIPPLHRSWEDMVRIARRRVRRAKGWTWDKIAAADHVAMRVAQETVRRFEDILNA